MFMCLVLFVTQAETLEDLHEWKAALEEALTNAPNAALVTGQNGMLKNEQSNTADASSDQCIFLSIKMCNYFLMFLKYCAISGRILLLQQRRWIHRNNTMSNRTTAFL